MRKCIAAINLTLDGYCDHTAVTPDEAIHEHYADLIRSAGVLLYGRITYQLMQYWQDLVLHPSGIASMDAFAEVIDRAPKIVFSRTLPGTGWESATLADASLESMVRRLKQEEGAPVLVGSRSLLLQLMQLDLVDEYQFCIHPVLAGGGLPLFASVTERKELALVNTKRFASGAVILYYKPQGKGVL